MTDKQFLELKNQIKEYSIQCHEIYQSSIELKNEILELDESFLKLQSDVHELQSELNNKLTKLPVMEI